MSEIKVKMGSSKAPEASADPDFKPFFIGEYLLNSPLTTKNSGFSQWGFCQKDGTEYFIKEFLSPVYPDDKVNISPAIKNRKCKECNDWFNQKQKIYNKICEAANGNIIAPFRFFKHNSHFYIVTDKVPPCSLKFGSVKNLPYQQKHILLKVLAASFSSLASKGIVHADVKPENILFKSTLPYQYTAKIIDFDGSYLESDAPFGDDVKGTEAYLAPESYLALAEQKVALTPKVDVFALGIIFHEMLCGKKPAFSKEYDYLHAAVLSDAKVTLDSTIPSGYRSIIENMLKKDAAERWSAAKVFNRLSQMTEKDIIS